LDSAKRVDEALLKTVAARYGEHGICAITLTILEIYVLDNDYEVYEKYQIFFHALLLLISLCCNCPENRNKFVEAGACDVLWRLLHTSIAWENFGYSMALASAIREVTNYGFQHATMQLLIKRGMTKEIFVLLEFVDDDSKSARSRKDKVVALKAFFNKRLSAICS
jgi:hypothetical protein